MDVPGTSGMKRAAADAKKLCQCRYLNKRVPRELNLWIKCVLGPNIPDNVREEYETEGNQTRILCPSKMKCKTTHKCDICMKHVCLQCSKPICKECL